MFFKKSDSVSLEKSSDDASIRQYKKAIKKSKINLFFNRLIAKDVHVSSLDSVFEQWQNIIDMQDYFAEHYREFSYKREGIILLEFYDSECGKESALLDIFDWDFSNIDPKEILLSEDFKYFEEYLTTKSMFTGVRLCDICKEVLTRPKSISQSD